MNIKQAVLGLAIGFTAAAAVDSAFAATTWSGSRMYVETLAGYVSPSQWAHCMAAMSSDWHCTIQAIHYTGNGYEQYNTDGVSYNHSDYNE